MVEVLLKHPKIDVNYATPDGGEALMEAAWSGRMKGKKSNSFLVFKSTNNFL